MWAGYEQIYPNSKPTDTSSSEWELIGANETVVQLNFLLTDKNTYHYVFKIFLIGNGVGWTWPFA